MIKRFLNSTNDLDGIETKYFRKKKVLCFKNIVKNVTLKKVFLTRRLKKLN